MTNDRELGYTHVLWKNGLVVKVLDSQSRGPMFMATAWLQGRLSLPGIFGSLVVEK